MPKGKFLGEFELYVMLAIKHLADEAYGVTIRRQIEERTERSVSIGSVYATGSRLVQKGLLDVSVSAPLPIKGGRSRKMFRLTPTGESALRHSTDMLSRMSDGVELEPRSTRSAERAG